MRISLLALLLVGAPIALAAGEATRVVTKSTPINAATASANYTQSQGTNTGNAIAGSYQCKWSSLTGILDGHFDIEVSNDGGLSWVAKTLTPQPAVSPDPAEVASLEVAGATGTGMVPLVGGQVVEELYRIKWVKEGVTGGTVSCFVIFKG